jgi:YVTN family beta-propeller protein
LPLACTLCSDATALRTVPVGLTPIVAAINSSAGQVLVANFTGDSVSVLDIHSGRVLRTIAVGLYPSALAVDPHTGEAFVANAGSNSVSIVDTHILRLMGTIPVSQYPSAIAAAGGCVLVTNEQDNTVSVLAGR